MNVSDQRQNTEQQNMPRSDKPQSYYPIGSAIFWIFILYVPTIVLSIFFAAFADANPNIENPRDWFFDGDTTSIYTILMALVTLPLVYIGIFRESQRRKYLALHQPISFDVFKPYLFVTFVYLIASVVIHTLIETQTPEFMLQIRETTDHIWLSVIAICMVAPIFEEIVFRGFIYQKLASTRLRNSGAIIFTAVLFTLAHGQYSGLVLVDLFCISDDFIYCPLQNA